MNISDLDSQGKSDIRTSHGQLPHRLLDAWLGGADGDFQIFQFWAMSSPGPQGVA